MWVFPREKLDLNYQASAAPSRIAAVVYVKGRKTGRIQKFYAGASAFTVTRAIVTQRFSEEVTEEGEIVGACVSTFGNNLKRGQFLVSITIGTLQEARIVCQGYLYDGRWVSFPMNEDPVSGRGYMVTNEGTTTLVNNTAVTRTLTVPNNVRWEFEAGHVFNADDVAREITIIKDDTVNEAQRFLDLHDLAATTLLNFPNVVADNIAESKAYRFTMIEAHRILITYAAGGASAGGTGRSMFQVQEWIQS